MSLPQPIQEIDYPESDGLPMGETELHRRWIQYIDDLLCQRYRGQQVYVGSELLVYYEEGQPLRFLVPDNFVVLHCDPSMRRVFKIWEEGCVPDVVFEVSSRSTSQVDQILKLRAYQQIGVKEYFLYDPSEAYLNESLQGYRLQQGAFSEIPEIKDRTNNKAIDCLTLGIRLSLDDERLVLTDIGTGAKLLTEAETERQAKEAERQAKEKERQAKEAEIVARRAAEARIAELEAEIRVLKQGRNE